MSAAGASTYTSVKYSTLTDLVNDIINVVGAFRSQGVDADLNKKLVALGNLFKSAPPTDPVDMTGIDQGGLAAAALIVEAVKAVPLAPKYDTYAGDYDAFTRDTLAFQARELELREKGEKVAAALASKMVP